MREKIACKSCGGPKRRKKRRRQPAMVGNAKPELQRLCSVLGWPSGKSGGFGVEGCEFESRLCFTFFFSYDFFCVESQRVATITLGAYLIFQSLDATVIAIKLIVMFIHSPPPNEHQRTHQPTNELRNHCERSIEAHSR